MPQGLIPNFHVICPSFKTSVFSVFRVCNGYKWQRVDWPPYKLKINTNFVTNASLVQLIKTKVLINLTITYKQQTNLWPDKNSKVTIT